MGLRQFLRSRKNDTPLSYNSMGSTSAITTRPMYEQIAPAAYITPPHYMSNQREFSVEAYTGSGLHLDERPICSNTARGQPSLTPTSSMAGDCRQCLAPNKFRTSRKKRENINGGRLYRSCSSRTCNAFNGFADDRGLDPGNQQCDCNQPSRLVAKNKFNTQGFRELFYGCRDGNCDFFAEHTGRDGEVAQFTDADLMRMAQTKQI